MSLRLNKSIFLLLLALNAYAAEPSWHQRKCEGWYYFQDEEPSLFPEEAQEILEKEKRETQEALSLALLDPTEEHVEQFHLLSKRDTEKSARFADMWGKVESAPSEKASGTAFLLFCFRGEDPRASQAAQEAQALAERHGWVLRALSLDGRGTEGLETFETDRGMAKRLGIEPLSAPSLYAVDPQQHRVIALSPEGRSDEE